MYNEVPVIGNQYNFGDWAKYAIHDEKYVKGFFGEYRWLSNFHYCDIWFEGLKYNCSENAYQASKIVVEERKQFTNCPPAKSKKLWKKCNLLYTIEGFDEIKIEVMTSILFDKFYRNLDIRKKLLDTGDKLLEETNHWKDQFWGVDINLGGKNHLGKILMKIREFWK